MKINYGTKVITLTVSEKKEAETYGTEMYKALREVRHDNPDFKIAVAKAKRNATIKGFDVETMRKYIVEHDGEESEMVKTFNELRGLDENGNKKEFAAVATYGELRQWFLESHPELLNLRNGIEKIMEV